VWGRTWQSWTPFVVLAVLVVSIGAIWAVAPEGARGLVHLVGGAVIAVLYVAVHALQRRRHW
jgi:hypothetical protein